MGAEPLTLLFDTPKTIPVSINLVLPGGDGTILSHEKTEEGDSAVARIGEDGGIGMLVEITDIHGKKIWHHDFGYNDSAAPGCRVTVSCHPKLPVILVHYYGYKWDHDHRLLFIETNGSGAAVREYLASSTDVLPILKRQKECAPDYDYWIHPARFIGDQITFACIPLQKEEKQPAHPLAQDQQWYDVTASIDSGFKITPTDARPTH